MAGEINSRSQSWKYCQACRDDPCKVRSRKFQTRVGVHFNQPDLEVVVHQEVISEHFKTVLLSIRINFLKNRFNGIIHQLLNLRQNIILHSNFFVRVMGVQVSLKVSIRSFVPYFKFPVFFLLLLHGVISQVNSVVFQVLGVKRLRSGS